MKIKFFLAAAATLILVAGNVRGDETSNIVTQSSKPLAADDISRAEKGASFSSAGKEGPLDRALTAKVRATLAGKDASQTTATGPSARSDIEVSSFHGVVTLRGKVNSQAEKQALIDKVQNLGGVTIVKNELQVTAPPTLDSGSPGKQGTEKESGKGH